MMDKKKTFYIINDRVCTRLKLHGEDIKELLIRNGWIETDQEHASFVFINTCAFLKHVEEKTMLEIKKISENLKKQQKAVVFGCLPHINPNELEKSFKGKIIYARELDAISKEFNLDYYEPSVSHQFERKLNWISKINLFLNKVFFKDPYFTYLYDKKRVFHLKISEGCLGNCSYCAEKTARGKLKSKSMESVIKEFEYGLNKGYKVFSLNSDDTAVFGVDNNETVTMLLSKILSYDANFKLVITEFNPWGFMKYREELLNLLCNPKVVFITVPIQSGSQRILKSMHRPYLLDDVIKLLTELKNKNDNIRINTHIIVGFPGETEKDFRDTFNLIKSFDFNKLKVFEYSDREITESYNYANKVSAKVKKHRKKRLMRYFLLRSLLKFQIKKFLLNVGYFY